MHKHPAASLHVKRHLSPAELFAIAAGLELLVMLPPSEQLDAIRSMFSDGHALPSDDKLRALAHEILHARKVKVCRSKTSSA